MINIDEVVTMLRLFIAINCGKKTKERLLSVQSEIKSQSYKGNFSRPENLHLTLVFVGETPEEQVASVCAAIKDAMSPPVEPFTLSFSQTGCFRHSNKELWWIGAKDDPSVSTLKNLRQRITSGLSASGVKFDNRAFNPHITLGREIKHEAPITVSKQEILFPVKRISLMQSERINKTLVYTEIFGQDLG